MKDWYLQFQAEHMILAGFLKILLAVVIFIAAVFILGLICSLIYAVFKRIVGWFNGMNRRLDRMCEPNKSSNPWGMVFALAWAALFYFAPYVSKRGISEFWARETVKGIAMHKLWGLIILGLIILVGIFSAKHKYPAVLFAKIVRIPLDLISLPFRFIYMVTGIIGSLTGAIKPVEGTVYLNSGTSGARGVQPMRGYRPGYVPGPESGSSSQESGYASQESSYSYYSQSGYSESGTDGFAYLGEKNDQQRAAAAGGSDGYNYTVTPDGTTQYFTGDYRPFNENGDTVEVYHLDEGMSPMDND